MRAKIRIALWSHSSWFNLQGTVKMNWISLSLIFGKWIHPSIYYVLLRTKSLVIVNSWPCEQKSSWKFIWLSRHSHMHRLTLGLLSDFSIKSYFQKTFVLLLDIYFNTLQQFLRKIRSDGDAKTCNGVFWRMTLINTLHAHILIWLAHNNGFQQPK